MFTYRCPACGKHHTADKNFDKAFEAKCLRCGSLIDVTPELIQQAPGAASSSVTLPPRPELFTKAPAGSGVRVAAKAASVTAPAVDDPALDAPSLPEDSATVEAAPRKKGPSKRKEPAKNQDDKADKKTPVKPEPASEQKEETATDPERPRWTPPDKTPPSKKGLKPRWQLIAAVSAVVLVLFGTIGFFAFGGKKATSKPRAKPVAKSTPKPTTKPAPPPPPPQKVEPAVQGPPPADVIVSAPRLSAELAANADFANIQYTGKILEVSGLLAKIENQEGLRPPARPHAVFATSGTPISCDLQDSTPPAAAWNRLQANQPFTIRGQYQKKGYLSGCFLMPGYTSSADSRYKGKIIEVSGRVASVSTTGDSQQFPTVVFEGETNSLMEIHCLFRMTDAPEVSKIQPGFELTIQGMCAGRQGDSKSIRLDNCAVVDTSAPPPKVVRINAIVMLREYEEDLRPDYLPPPGEEPQVPTVWTIRQLYNTYTADPKGFVQKYRNHVLRLRCKPPPPPQLHSTRGKPVVVTLTSGDTDLAFQIECYFSAAAGEELSKHSEAEYQIRGLFTGQIDAKKLRLDNCDVDMPRRAGPSLTADYLPHKAGRSFTIDVATFGTMVNGKARDVVQREVHVQGEGGVTEIVLTHAGSLTGKSLFDEGVQEKWVQQKKVAIKAPATTGLYFRRLNAGFVELGTPYQVAKGKTEVAWMPMVKLHAQAGDKWKLESPAGPRDFVLEKFDEFQGHPCAVIRELFTPASDILHPLETLHVYAQDLGEVERRQWRHLDQRGGKILISEMKRVAKPEAGLETKPAAKPPPAPARPASEPRPSGRGSKSTR